MLKAIIEEVKCLTREALASPAFSQGAMSC